MTSPLLFLMAAILPPALDDWKKIGTAELPALEQPAAAREFGLLESEAGRYEQGKKAFALAVYRLKDNTGALAFEQSLRAPGSARRLFRHQNYVFETLEGTAPRGALDAFLLPTLPKTDRTATPNLLRYLPARGRVSGSERYILGPESLKAYAPKIPPGAAGFDFSGELQAAEYQSPEGGAWLGVFQYPNQLIARQQAEALERALTGLPSVALKREGPLVAVVLPAGQASTVKPETAQALTNPIVYKAEVVMDKKPPKPEPNPGEFLIGVFKLAGILLGLCLLFGITFALLFRLIRSKTGGGDGEAVTTLRI
jgi:hypothetical protein